MLPPGGLLRPGWHDAPPGGESYARWRGTFVHTLLEQIRVHAREGHVTIVGHACINRSFLKLWFGLKSSEALSIYLPHETFHILGNNGEANWMDTEGATGKRAPSSPLMFPRGCQDSIYIQRISSLDAYAIVFSLRIAAKSIDRQLRRRSTS